MPAPAAGPDRIRLAALPRRAPQTFVVMPDAETRAALAEALDLSAIRKLRFEGALHPEGARDWRLKGTLGATVVQPCRVTLAPVTTRIDEPVERQYLAEPPEAPAGGETEMPDDDSIEPVPDTLDLAAVMAEALALAVPPFPRAAGAAEGDARVTEPGKAPLDDEDVKPFARLAALRDKLKDGD